MIVFINKKNEIKDVDTTTDVTLTPVEISDELNPFANWSVAKICCQKISLTKDGKYKGFTPYVDSRLIEHIDKLSRKDAESEERLTSVEEAVDILVLESLGF